MCDSDVRKTPSTAKNIRLRFIFNLELTQNSGRGRGLESNLTRSPQPCGRLARDTEDTED